MHILEVLDCCVLNLRFRESTYFSLYTYSNRANGVVWAETYGMRSVLKRKVKMPDMSYDMFICSNANGQVTNKEVHKRAGIEREY